MDSKKESKEEFDLKHETKQETTNEQYTYKSQKQMEQLRTYVYKTEGKRDK